MIALIKNETTDFTEKNDYTDFRKQALNTVMELDTFGIQRNREYY
jgi:hypothetical protein